MREISIALTCALFMVALPVATRAQDSVATVPDASQWQDLEGDDSRAALAEYEILNYGPPGDKAVRRAFAFPGDADDGLYGVDVSHHNGQVDWSLLSANGVKFAYIKATQGGKFLDKRFLANWADAGKAAGVRRGAYHFLSADTSGAEQGENFVRALTKAGGLGEADLAPVLDLEWHFETVNGKKLDRWRNLAPDAIAQQALDWIAVVEKATGRKPIIYTADSWWSERLKTSLALQAYPHWIADYRNSSINAGAPKSVAKHQYLAWQFTDVGTVGSAASRYDINKLKGGNLDRLSGK